MKQQVISLYTFNTLMLCLKFKTVVQTKNGFYFGVTR